MAFTEQDLKMSNADSMDELSEEMKIRALLRTWNPVRSPDDDLFNEKLMWCLQHCDGKFRDLRDMEGRIWYFQNSKDASMFALKWG